MKNKGFTLIELLAVIVVLAIIALIATPIIMNIIGNIQEGANARSVEGYMRAYEAKYYAEYAATGKEPNTNSITLTTGDYNGAKVECGHTIRLNSDNKFEATCTVNNQTYKYENGKATKVGSVAGTTPNSPSSPSSPSEPEVGFPDDVTIPGNQLCVLVEGNTAGMIGAQYVCELGDNKNRVFYVLENKQDSSNISLIMNMNYDYDMLPWCDPTGPNPNSAACNADGLTSKLNEIRDVWTKLNRYQITLPTGQQIADAGGDTEWTSSVPSDNILPIWLYDDLYIECTSSLPQGYWTSTARDEMNNAWIVYHDGRLASPVVTINSLGYCKVNSGVRPVITVAKTSIGL